MKFVNNIFSSLKVGYEQNLNINSRNRKQVRAWFRPVFHSTKREGTECEGRRALVKKPKSEPQMRDGESAHHEEQ